MLSRQVEKVGYEGILVSTEYSKLPQSSRGLYRVDLGPNVATFARIDNMLDQLQREEPAKCVHACDMCRGNLTAQTLLRISLIPPCLSFSRC